ncbi:MULTISPECIES: YkgJ family cysteine cluster protein [Pseudomonas]|uniref:YkgJ family cysteine cluster protein n=1 Tax=Pseudomonas brenneri TaxID=129817 RepID=A0A5B2UNT9_9PSED|nr:MULTISPECIES: YkgJ family cysteine cluster protein [Pseudomonas]KAA6167405.1 YkgJ family cysteine cluster protein [Pseudomonas marginalis]MDZ4301994.1 YkgJ family cysteine cluster protein [Pseudomonas sp.]KAA2228140.1 YkgJ family cysteine cluster protein [Pseudomonas brenneri]MBF8006017.1 YkgJ family cysteine cluster protein [Pseudomonas brenneri]TWR78825.1 YkgJ family cysteine cluster protein [Pseudomonas brenneri]
MSDASPCLSCGACCSYFRVSFFWGECASSGGTVPDDLVVQINPSRVAMIGTDQKPARCCSLEGEVGSGTRCSIYEQRSSVCRDFESSWSQGEVNVDCDAARAAFGLAPLEQPPYEFELPISA